MSDAELTDESIRLADLSAALQMLDLAVEIAMSGTGHSLNVAVAGSLVL